MSKLTTIYNVMSQLKQQENEKASLDIRVSVDEKVILETKKETSLISRGRRQGRHHRQCRGMGMGMGHHMSHMHGMGNLSNDEMRKVMESRMKEMGYTDEEISEFEKAHDDMKSFKRPSKLDRGMFMIKTLNAINIIEEKDGKVLSLNMEHNDLPEEMKAMMKHKKAFRGMRRKFKDRWFQEGCGHPTSEKGLMMREVMESLEEAEIDIVSLHPDHVKIQVGVDEQDALKYADIKVTLNDEFNQEVKVHIHKTRI